MPVRRRPPRTIEGGFVPKPEPSSAHGGSGRYLLKVGIDPPTPERFPQLGRSED